MSVICMGAVKAQNTPTPGQILDKAVEVMSNPKGIESKFTIYNSGYSGGGSLKILGKKFVVALPDLEVWYNGKDLYTYNKRTNETTVVNPTDEELAESNPLSYITGAKGNYNVATSTVKKDGRYVLELTPKKRGTEIKRITLTLKKNDYSPEKIVVEPVGGSPITAEISFLKAGGNISASEFEYPKAKYSKVEIIDLR